MSIIDNNRTIFINNYQKLSQDIEFGRFHISWDALMPIAKNRIFKFRRIWLSMVRA